MRNLRNLCVAVSALATFTFAAPIVNQNAYAEKTKPVLVQETDESQQITPRRFNEVSYIAWLTSFKTGKDFKQSLEEDAGVSFEAYVKYITGSDNPKMVDKVYQGIKKDLEKQLSEGKTVYAVKKAVFPKDILEHYLSAIDPNSTEEFETVLMSSDNPSEINYKQKDYGLEIYLVRADSREDAVQKSSSNKPIFHLYGDTTMLTCEMVKEFDSVFTTAIKDPSTIGNVFDAFATLSN